MRRIFGILLSVSLLGGCVWEAYRGALVLLLRRGHYSLLERWGGEALYLPALRHYASHSPAGVESRNEMYEWVQHRFSSRFPDEEVRHWEILPTGELALLLRRSDESKNKTGLDDECRVVILDPDHSDLLTAASEAVDHNAWRMRWQEDWVFLEGGGSITLSLAYRREGSVLHLIPTRMNVQGAPYFWGPSEFEDVDGDGIPEVVAARGDQEACPRCGQTLVPGETIWKLTDGSFQEWSGGTERDSWCPACRDFPWSD